MKDYTYDEFGNLEEGGTQEFLNETTYTGSVKDESTGLQYMNARYYNPESGRFLSQDTYSGNAYEPWTQHLYSYCGNNPTSMVDPTGHFFWFVVAAVVLYAGASVASDALDDGEVNRPVIEHLTAGAWGLFDGLTLGQGYAARKAAGTIAKETIFKQGAKQGAKSIARAGAGAIDDVAIRSGIDDAERWVAKSTRQQLRSSQRKLVEAYRGAAGLPER